MKAMSKDSVNLVSTPERMTQRISSFFLLFKDEIQHVVKVALVGLEKLEVTLHVKEVDGVFLFR